LTKHTILFLAANPNGTDHLSLDREARLIQEQLESARARDSFQLATRWAVEPLDLLREMRKLKPTIVHFSGHGSQKAVGAPRTGSQARRDVVLEDNDVDGTLRHGLYFHRHDGKAQPVSATALKSAFGAAGASVQLIVLNACYTDAQAEILLEHIPCVVGMGGSILDDAARTFAVDFYGALAGGESVGRAYEQGRAAIDLSGLRDSELPQLKLRAGIDAERFVLAPLPP
jgi:hypothetical protein